MSEPMGIQRSVIPQDWADDSLDEERARTWHDFEVYGGKAYPVLWYTVDRSMDRVRWPVGQTVTTEACIWCGKSHHHGNLPGSRVPHCGDHSHELTPTGRRRSIWAKGVTRCSFYHRDYILRLKP